MSYILKFSNTSTDLVASYFPPINLKKDSEIGLLSLSTYYSFANIDESNNEFNYDNGKVIIFPTGAYEIHQINDF